MHRLLLFPFVSLIALVCILVFPPKLSLAIDLFLRHNPFYYGITNNQ